MHEHGPNLVLATGGATSGASPHVLVISSQRLVRDTLSTALRSAGFTTSTADVPTGIVHIHAARRRISTLGPVVGVLAADIYDATHLREAVAVVSVLDLEWLLLTSTPRGAAWGALIEAGVHDVLGATTSLEELGHALRRLAEGRPPVPVQAHEEALRAWRDAPEERRVLTRRIEALSPREMEILVDLHRGDSPKVIAARAGVAEGTVRSQVKSMLRKLAVSSQIQAVASYRDLNDWIAS